jgi:hypothetical protein
VAATAAGIADVVEAGPETEVAPAG